MARYYVNPDSGGVGTCSASRGKCPFGGESGEANHYGDKASALARAEELMAAVHGGKSHIRRYD